jgi:hypothetical protein
LEEELSKSRYTKAQLDQGIKLRKEGLSLARISEIVGPPKQFFEYHFNKLGVKPPHGKANRRYTKAQFEEVFDLRLRGLTVGQISRKTGIPVGVVDYNCRKEGVFPPGYKIRAANHVKQHTDKNGVTRRPVSQAEHDEILRLRVQGWPILKIAQKLDRPTNTVRYRLISAAAREQVAEAS